MFLSVFVHCICHSSSESWWAIALISLLLFPTSSVQKLRAGNNGFDKRGHLVPARRQLRPHRIEKRLIRKHQRAAKRVHKCLFTQIVQKIILATGANITSQAVESGAPPPARERRLDIYRATGEVFGSPL